MPRRSLPDEIERNDRSTEHATPAELEVIEQLPALWQQCDSIPDMADELEWSSSHVGNVWRKYFRAAGDGDEPTSHDHSEAHQTNGDRGGNLVTIRVEQIPDNEREALAFLRGVKSAAQ